MLQDAMLFSLEGGIAVGEVPLKAQPQNEHWIDTCFGPEMVKEMADAPISCAGTMVSYCSARIACAALHAAFVRLLGHTTVCVRWCDMCRCAAPPAMLRDTAESAGRRQGHVSHTGVPQTPPACGPPAGITIGSVAAVHGYVTQLLATAYQDASSKCRSGSSRGRHALQNNSTRRPCLCGRYPIA